MRGRRGGRVERQDRVGVSVYVGPSCDQTTFSSEPDTVLIRLVFCAYARQPKYSLLQFKPATGRKHQLRVHAAESLRGEWLHRTSGGGSLRLSEAESSLTFHALGLLVDPSANCRRLQIRSQIPAPRALPPPVRYDPPAFGLDLLPRQYFARHSHSSIHVMLMG